MSGKGAKVLTAVCSVCGGYVTDNPRKDNRYRGCDLCGWVMHHGCWIERLSLGTLPCGQGGPDGPQGPRHGDVIGMRGEWGPLL